ncbi:MAG: TetR/AcrR family transcriptional regulator [Burkholderiaceae bacterium]|nr:TetR/AcrR family transcriptional regulator [Microbacteriaceae bacterium]
MTTALELRDIALGEFAAAGYAGTSINRIAGIAGISKSAVLYHFASKEALLEQAVSPAIDRMEEMFLRLEATALTAQARREFVEQFTDFLLDHRLEVHLFINQGPSLVDVPVVERANGIVRRLAAYFASTTASTEEKMRFGIALGGAAYMLCSEHSLELEAAPVDETRAALVSIMGELLAPSTARSAPHAAPAA